MKRLLWIFFLFCGIQLSQVVHAQVFVNFESPTTRTDTIEGFFDAKWYGPMASFARVADTTKRSGYVLSLGCDGSLADRAVVQSYNRDPKGAAIVSFHIYLPANFPDSAVVSVWGDDNKTGWNWNSTDYYGIDLPKQTWVPVYFYMERTYLKAPLAFNPYGGNILSNFGIQIFYFDRKWKGTVLIDDAAFLQKSMLVDFERTPAKPDTIEGFFDAKWYGPTAKFARVADSTKRSGYVLSLGCDGSLADRAVVQKTSGVDDKEAPIIGFHIYLPSNFPDSAIVSVWGDDNTTGWNWNSTDYTGKVLPKQTWFPIYFLMERTMIKTPLAFNVKGANFLSNLGLQIFYADRKWKGTVLVDDNALYGPGFPPTVTAVQHQSNLIPETTKLYPSYPNPFNPSTTIRYDLRTESHMRLEIFNMLGQSVKTLVSSNQKPGSYSVTWDGTDDSGAKVGSGIYLYDTDPIIPPDPKDGLDEVDNLIHRRQLYEPGDEKGCDTPLFDRGSVTRSVPGLTRFLADHVLVEAFKRRFRMKMWPTVRSILWMTLSMFMVSVVPSFAQEVAMENDTLKVLVERATGCFTVTEKISGQVWNPDPWEHSAALLTLRLRSGKQEIVNLSKAQTVQVEKNGDYRVLVRFRDPVREDGSVATGIIISTELQLQKNTAVLTARVLDVSSTNDYALVELRFPSRHFSLRTDQDMGAGVIPQWQGVICPSYIFPMTGGRFCQWDDAEWDDRSYGTLKFYDFNGGLSMPWFGTYNQKSAVMGILAKEPSAQMEYIINNNGQNFFDAKGQMSPYPRILALTPIWNLGVRNSSHVIDYHFIPKGDYVHMAKRYRQVAMERGYFVSLKEKAMKNPNVSKLAGAVYVGLYGGYPHYVNMKGMAFDFKQLESVVRDLHDNLKVENAFVHAWGTFSNYPPNNWPISKELGGPDGLRKAVSLAKEYGYLYSSYHAYSPRLEHDPNFDMKLFPRLADDSFRLWGRWNRVDSKYYYDLCRSGLTKELELIGQNADVTDILFIGTPDEGKIRLAKYLRSLNLVMGTERGQEHYIPYFDLFEGMTYYYSVENGMPLATISHHAPLFNLVYHDAVANYGKIQDPDNDVTFQGDFSIKSLQNILYGNGTLLFMAPYEYEGIREMILMSNKLVSPVHKETFFEELVDHEFLSADFKVQRSRFANGTEVWVNLGPVEQKLVDGTPILGYGFRVKHQNGEIFTGSFKTTLDVTRVH